MITPLIAFHILHARPHFDVLQPAREIRGHQKLMLRNLAVPGLPRGAYLVISQADSDGNAPVKVRLQVGSHPLATTIVDYGIFFTEEPVRLFRIGSDYLLAFWNGSGDTMFVNFIRVSPTRPRLKFEGQFDDPTVHHFQRTGRLDEHLKFEGPENLPRTKWPGVYTRHWHWSNGRHQFILTGHSYEKGRDVSDDSTLR